MSLATIERAILHGTREALNNPRLRKKDILGWSVCEVEPQDGEVVVRVPDPPVNVAVKKKHDKRGGQ